MTIDLFRERLQGYLEFAFDQSALVFGHYYFRSYSWYEFIWIPENNMRVSCWTSSLEEYDLKSMFEVMVHKYISMLKETPKQQEQRLILDVINFSIKRVAKELNISVEIV